MRKHLILTAAAISGIALPALVFAAGGPSGQPGMDMGMMDDKPVTRASVEAKIKDHFAQVDANHDGFITQDEMKAMHERQRTEMRGKHFETMDGNKDGSISRAEFDAAHKDGPDMEKAGEGPGMMSESHESPDGMRVERRVIIRQEGGMPMMGAGMMMAADANKDGKISQAEALAQHLARFDAADTNKDAILTPEERKAARGAMRMGRMGGKRR